MESWAQVVSMLVGLTVIIGIVGTIIAGMVVRPMLTKLSDEIREEIHLAVKDLVSKEMFNVYAANDQREHNSMQRQLSDIFERLNK